MTEAAEARGGRQRLTDPNEIEGLMWRVTSANRVVLVLDYDGTLVGLREMPELATPDAGLLGLLTVLSTTCDVHLASGRPREVIEGWFGNLPIGLWAEHGLWHRSAPGEPWPPPARAGRARVQAPGGGALVRAPAQREPAHAAASDVAPQRP